MIAIVPTSVGGALMALLPDRPRWVQGRSLLLGGRGRVAIHERARDACVVVADDSSLGVIVGCPSPEALATALAGWRGVRSWLWPDVGPDTPAAATDALSAYRPRAALLHTLPEKPLARLRPDTAADVRWLMSPHTAVLSLVPEDLQRVLAIACERTTVAAAFDGGVPVSFGYAAFETESWWELSVDTVPAARGRGHAEAVARFLIDHFRRLGRAPVWGATPDSVASLAAARRLGFVVVDRLTLFSSAP
jgi:RimJ/RimL family protein N-acetyltransferase